MQLRSGFLLLLSLCATGVLSVRRNVQWAQQSDNSSQHSLPPEEELPAQEDFLARRAIYVRWGSLTCPFGSKLLYHGFMANSHYNINGSGYNYLCMHPEPQFPQVGFKVGDQFGASLYGVEYEDTGVFGLDEVVNKDAACAVCQYQNGGATYVEWGHGESRHNPSTQTQCSEAGHETIYTGLVMGNHFHQMKSEHICVDLERAAHPTSDDKDDNGGHLYTTEMETGASDEDAYKANIEVGCTVCGIPARTRTPAGLFQLNPDAETSVYTRWGHTSCGSEGRLIYTGFIAGSAHQHTGGGANSICMTVSGAKAPWGSSDGNENGNLLYGTEYQDTGVWDKNHDKDAACAVCEYNIKHTDTYIQWGRRTCSDGILTHKDPLLVYEGLVMGNEYRQKKSMHLCVDQERLTHERSSDANNNGNLLYTTEVEAGASDETRYPANSVAACTECAAPRAGRTIFTRWGSESCPASSSLLYKGWMASSRYEHTGGGANTLCMHIQGRGILTGKNKNGNLLYGMEYQGTGADKDDKDAACAVCELDRWEAVYTQWGRSDTCDNGHQTLYSGLVMSNADKQQKGEFVCVDGQRQAHATSQDANHNGGLLYMTEMNQGSSDEEQYPNGWEVGCSVCAAISQKDEKPFAAQQGNTLHGQWVKLRTLHTGQEVTVGYGFEQSQGAASTKEEAREASIALSWDMHTCFSASFEGGPPFASAETGVEVCAGRGFEAEMRVSHTTARETSWDTSLTETTEDTFSVPDVPPAGTPESATIQTHGVHLWQWQWTIFDASKDKQYTAKANSHYLFSPNDPGDGNPRKPCCFPGHEFSLWYPFNCKSEAGMLEGAENAQYCRVGLPTDSADHIASMTTEHVTAWLGGLGLSGDYASTVSSQGLHGKALSVMVKIVDKAAINHGDSDSARALELVKETFAVEHMGDAYIIMDALIALLASGE